MQPLKNITSNIKEYAKTLSQDGFHQIFNHIDQLKVKEGVDRLGLDKFIDQCAYLAAGSGVISGSGGLFTMVIGIPLDFMNLITQQFRVTMAIMYAHRGAYNIGFNEFMGLVAASLKVEASVAITKTMMESVAGKNAADFRYPYCRTFDPGCWRCHWRYNQLPVYKTHGQNG